MIGVPMPDPRDSILANLNQQLEQYFKHDPGDEIIPPASYR